MPNPELIKFRREVRRALADYMQAEGCSCCRNQEAHTKAANELGKLLKVPKYKDTEGCLCDHDFSKFRSKKEN